MRLMKGGKYVTQVSSGNTRESRAMSGMDLDDRPLRAAKTVVFTPLRPGRLDADTRFADTRFGMMANSRHRFIVGRTNETTRWRRTCFPIKGRRYEVPPDSDLGRL